MSVLDFAPGPINVLPGKPKKKTSKKIIQHEPKLSVIVDLVDKDHDILLLIYKDDFFEVEAPHAACLPVADIKAYLDDEHAIPIEIVEEEQ